MSAALKCDMCGHLYESSKDDNHVVVQEASHSKLKIEAYMRLFTGRYHFDVAETIDHCQECTEQAVLKFMAHFGIKERKGEFFFARFDGKQVKITVEVL